VGRSCAGLTKGPVLLLPPAFSRPVLERGSPAPGRLRFRGRFTTQERILSYLPEIDAALMAAGKDQTWLHRKIQGPPFSRRTPLEHMVTQGMEGMAEVLQVLSRAAIDGEFA
jgi:hypothetical protein